MITVPSISVPSQEEFIALQKRVEVLEKQLGISKRKPTKKYPPLTPEEIEQAKAQIMLFLMNSPTVKMVTAWQISQQRTLLRRLGTAKIREHLEQLVQKSILIKEGHGKTARYCTSYSKEDQEARRYILSLRQGVKPDTLLDTGKWMQCIKHLVNAFDVDPNTIEYVIQAFIASNKYPGLKKLLD